MSYKTIIFEEEDGVATITLNRPASFNALNAELGKEFVDAIEKCTKDLRVKAIKVHTAIRPYDAECMLDKA